MIYQLCCEGAGCNHGRDAATRVSVLLPEGFATLNEGDRLDIAKSAESQVTRSLAVTPHVMSAAHIARCLLCGNERRYGRMW